MSTHAVIERFIVNELLLGEDRTTLDPDESLLSSGILDSMALLRLIAFIEEELGVTVEDGELTPVNFETLNNIKGFLESKTRSYE